MRKDGTETFVNTTGPRINGKRTYSKHKLPAHSGVSQLANKIPAGVYLPECRSDRDGEGTPGAERERGKPRGRGTKRPELCAIDVPVITFRRSRSRVRSPSPREIVPPLFPFAMQIIHAVNNRSGFPLDEKKKKEASFTCGGLENFEMQTGRSRDSFPDTHNRQGKTPNIPGSKCAVDTVALGLPTIKIKNTTQTVVRFGTIELFDGSSWQNTCCGHVEFRSVLRNILCLMIETNCSLFLEKIFCQIEDFTVSEEGLDTRALKCSTPAERIMMSIKSLYNFENLLQRQMKRQINGNYCKIRRVAAITTPLMSLGSDSETKPQTFLSLSHLPQFYPSFHHAFHTNYRSLHIFLVRRLLQLWSYNARPHDLVLP
ncbi:hypothetical protein WN51_05029 [Melipona quadrifasciata]|uniref:Uncharacterized protein n=1 Tax=Melipona quadrifasciata TaxID=166423 RepID=A0A0N0U3F3_9HYME|nr:hypothetical protein WN51_05029 [Melipona quadrifasciata]